MRENMVGTNRQTSLETEGEMLFIKTLLIAVSVNYSGFLSHLSTFRPVICSMIFFISLHPFCLKKCLF